MILVTVRQIAATTGGNWRRRIHRSGGDERAAVGEGSLGVSLVWCAWRLHLA